MMELKRRGRKSAISAWIGSSFDSAGSRHTPYNPELGRYFHLLSYCQIEYLMSIHTSDIHLVLSHVSMRCKEFLRLADVVTPALFLWRHFYLSVCCSEPWSLGVNGDQTMVDVSSINRSRSTNAFLTPDELCVWSPIYVVDCLPLNTSGRRTDVNTNTNYYENG